MKLEQVAFGLSHKHLWDQFAEKADVVDEVTFSGYFRGLYGQTTYFSNKIGYLAFDYTMGVEREYLYYPEPENTFHSLIEGQRDIFLSHLASHVPSIDSILSDSSEFDDNVVMDVRTNAHKNEKLIELGRKYRYTIIDWRHKYGYFYKLIQRIEKPGSAS